MGVISRWERRFPAMGTDCHVVIEGGRIGLLDHAEERIADLEARWSRFIAGSELSRLSRDKVRPRLKGLLPADRHWAGG